MGRGRPGLGSHGGTSPDAAPLAGAVPPFTDYFIPGLILFTLLEIGALIVALVLWRRQSWAWYGAFIIGGALIIWMVGYHPQPPLQLIYGALGIVLLALTLLPSLRRAVFEH